MDGGETIVWPIRESTACAMLAILGSEYKRLPLYINALHKVIRDGAYTEELPNEEMVLEEVGVCEALFEEIESSLIELQEIMDEFSTEQKAVIKSPKWLPKNLKIG